MDEKYGVKMVLDVGEFKSKLNQVSNLSSLISQKMKNNLKIDAGINMKLFDKNSWTKEIIESNNKISKLNFNSKALSNSFSLVKDNIYASTNELKHFNNEFQKVDKATNNAEKNLTNSFGKGLKSIKKLTLGLFGVRSAFSFFRNQLSNYKSQNEQFNSSMILTTDIITQTLAPAFEWFGNILQYTFIGLARIIELMFNVNILSKVTANGFKRASDSAKELNDNLTGLDEITNLSDDNSSTLSGIMAQLNALDEFQKKIAEVNKWLKDTGLDKFFPKLGQGIKDVWNWVQQHPFETLLGIGAFITLKGLLPSVLGVSGGTSGLWGIVTVLGLITAKNIIDIIAAWKELNDITNSNESTADQLALDWKELGNYADDFANKLTGEKVNTAFTTFSDMATKSIDDVTKKLDDLDKYKHFPFKTDPNKKTDVKLLDTYIEKLSSQLEIEKNLYNQGKLTKEQEEIYKNTLLKTKDALEKAGLKGYDYKETLKNINQQLDNLGVKQPSVTIDLDMDTSKAEKKKNGFFSNLWDSISGTWKALTGKNDPYNKKANGGIFVGNTWKNITAYAGGGLPSIGQMFVARESGPELVGTIGGHTAVMNNNQIVSSVSAGVAQAVASVLGNSSNDRPIVLNINGKEFARATYSDYQAESRRVGTNTSIRRY